MSLIFVSHYYTDNYITNSHTKLHDLGHRAEQGARRILRISASQADRGTQRRILTRARRNVGSRRSKRPLCSMFPVVIHLHSMKRRFPARRPVYVACTCHYLWFFSLARGNDACTTFRLRRSATDIDTRQDEYESPRFRRQVARQHIHRTPGLAAALLGRLRAGGPSYTGSR